jgi:hypothetical protein
MSVRASPLQVAGRAAAVLLCVAGVPALVLILIRTLFGVSITAYHPVINDEAAYWHQALTFSRVGFHGGYYTVDEVTNASGVTPFGPHGPGFAMLYGTFGAMFGWYRHSVVVLNLCAIALAAVVWVWLARLSLPRLFLSGVLLVTFWHMVFWAPTGMQEALHHAGAIVMAALFAATLDPSPRRWTRTAGWIVIAGLSFIRPSWVILVPIWAVTASRRSSRGVMLATVSASVVLIAAILFAYTRTAAPYGDGFFFLRALSLSLGVRAIADNVLSNLHRMSVPGQYQAIEILQRYQYVALLVTVTAAALVMWKRRRPQINGPEAHFGVATLAMGTALAAMLMLYEFTAFAEHRVLSAFLLFGALVCLRAPGWIGPLLAAGLIASNVLAGHTMLKNFESGRRDNFLWDRQGLIDLQEAIAGKVTYQPGASRWCNTLLTSQYPPHMIAIPAGIGLSVVVKPEAMAHGPRSRYLLLDGRMEAAFREPLHLQPIATLPYGTLYVNRDADCR